MGKFSKQQKHELLQQQQQFQSSSSQLSSSLFFCHSCSTSLQTIWNSCSFKCLFVLILSASLFLSALFLLPPFNHLNSGFHVNNADEFSAAAKVSFRLQKPVSLLVAHVKTLESDIFEEIGVPNIKISILSMNQSYSSNWTDVVFGALPDPMNAPMNLAALSVLKSSLVELFLHRLNLTLTASIFGQPDSFEILKFSGGITVIPVEFTPIWEVPQILFNFTLNNSISQLDGYFDQLKDQLKFGLRLRYDERLFVQLTNENGSTVNSPVIVQASVFSNVGNDNLLPQRLKQLAQIITRSPYGKNLGLDHSVFGKVKGISLSSALNRTLETSPGSPYPSPLPSPSDATYSPQPSISSDPAPFPSYSPPSGDHNLSPHSHCDPSSPSAPIPANGHQPPSPQSSVSSPSHGFAISPSPVPATTDQPSVPPRAASQHVMGPTQSLLHNLSPSPSMSYSTSPGQNILPFSSGLWLIGLLGCLTLVHLSCALYL